jgi:hypothetical protein
MTSIYVEQVGDGPDVLLTWRPGRHRSNPDGSSSTGSRCRLTPFDNGGGPDADARRAGLGGGYGRRRRLFHGSPRFRPKQTTALEPPDRSWEAKRLSPAPTGNCLLRLTQTCDLFATSNRHEGRKVPANAKSQDPAGQPRHPARCAASGPIRARPRCALRRQKSQVRILPGAFRENPLSERVPCFELS